MKKSIMILILIGIYILYLYKKYIYKKKNLDHSKIIIQPSSEHKRQCLLLGLLCFVCIGFIILLNMDFNVDAYTKVKIMYLRLEMPLYYLISAVLIWCFVRKLQPTVVYEDYISYQGKEIPWTVIYKIKRVSDTRLSIYYKNGINSRIDVLHASEQEMALNQIVEEVSSKVQNISTVDLGR